ncbi:MAG: hypothetical protein J2P26_01200 [Nocardiopsaceae bacterium]|nr:hypothetical protein [Nocardiopsaceae bacterium]
MTAAHSARLASRPGSERLSGRQAWGLLWRSSRTLGVGVIAWMVAGALIPPLVIAALGYVVGAIPGAIAGGMGSAAGHRLIETLAVAAVVYAASLILTPVGGALGTAAKQKITGDVQARLLRAVTALLVGGGIAATCYQLGYRLLVDGALAGSGSQLALGVAVVAGLLAISWVLTAIGAAEAMALSERIAVYRTGKLIELISGVPGPGAPGAPGLPQGGRAAELRPPPAVGRAPAGRAERGVRGPDRRAAGPAGPGVPVAAADPGHGGPAAARGPDRQADHQAVRG